ncbi:MAG: PD40 domain-containing protein [Candidatus Riflebacteria bacterium]|nr:PD40 domain-containing protein [Candidatus Riflebacteria bacterium]
MTHPSPRAIMVDDLYALKNIVDVQLSPCGTRIAFTVVAIDREADDYRSTIWVIAADGSGLESFTRGAGKDAAPRWSPDGRWLAFLSERFSRSPQLFVMPVRGGEARQLTTLERGAGVRPTRRPGGAGSGVPGSSPGPTTRTTGSATPSTR